MNKTAIKNFAVWARRKLIADITYKMGLLGITDSGIATPLPQSTRDLQFFDVGTKNYSEVKGEEIAQRKALVDALKLKERSSDYKTAFETLVEEVAYTWFNRLIAVRFMEVNDYLPSRVRVLSSLDSAKNEPDFVTNPFETDLEFTPEEQELIFELKDKNKLDELFRMLFIKQCNKLNEILPELFEKTNDYTELLLTISFTDKDGVVYRLVHDISENDFDVEKEGQVEIIGWLYQYYNIEPKDKVFELLKKNVKITKERIPAATQLFTPDWIVRYMVENSLGKLWIEHLQSSHGMTDEYLNGSFFGWKYYLEEAEQTAEVQKQLDEIRASYKDIRPEDIKFIDPCMGSGHILVYAFDVLMQIYESCGYSPRDAVKSILENNLYGLDIDKRASQLAYFAVMMKVRQYNRRILGSGIKPNVLEIKDSSSISDNLIRYASFGSAKAEKEFRILCDTFADAKELGSIIVMPELDIALLESCIAKLEDEDISNLDSLVYRKLAAEKLAPLVKQARIMQQKYDVVVTNPPYMGGTGMSPKIDKYIKDNYDRSKTDLYSVFIEKCNNMVRTNGYQAMITQHGWMFLSSFEKLRAYILNNQILSMAHLGAKAFDEIGGEVVQTVSFVLRKTFGLNSYYGKYVRLVDYLGESEKQKQFLDSCNLHVSQQKVFEKIPSMPLAYWSSENVISTFETAPPLSKIAEPRQGVKTLNNDLFLKLWFEVSKMLINFYCSSIEESIASKKKWFPYNKGGTYRKWFGNNDYVVNWYNDGYDMKKLAVEKYKSVTRTITNISYFFKPGLTWSSLSSGNISLRSFDKGYIFDSKGSSMFFNDDKKKHYVLALMNSKISMKFLEFLAPTLDFNIGPLSKIPTIIVPEYYLAIENFVAENILLAKNDWDSFEASWDFIKHPLLCFVPRNGMLEVPMNYTIASAFDAWNTVCEDRFNKLKSNEEELNRIFIDIYGLQDELTPEVEDKDVTVRKADLQRDIKSLISYAVGCMFGRYSIYKDGLMFAGGEWNEEDYKYAAYEASNPNGFPKDVYSSNWFMPDEDNCIPVTDEEYFEDDVVGRFVNFIKTVYGEETLEENLDFIAFALGNKGSTSREVIRNYFLNDFIKDHIKTYQKRPIYWMFDSGKQNGFKALVYMHRWDSDTIGNMRVEYLHRMQRVYENEIIRMQETIDNSANNREVAAAEKRKDKLQKQLKESKDFDAKVANLALSRIDIDLDDGVKVNYQKVQTTPDGKNMGVLFKI